MNERTELDGALADATLPLRLAAGLLVATLITLSLFWVMNYLIESGNRYLDDAKRGSIVDFVRVKKEEIVERKRIKPDKPPPPKAPPTRPPVPRLESPKAAAQKVKVARIPVRTDIKLSHDGFSLGAGGGDYLPIVKVAPIYPQRALRRGIEGHCDVQFTVTRAGTTRDVKIVDGQCTSAAFEDAAISAALKFKYRPRVVEGKSVEVTGVRNRFTFRIEQ
ncbi:MAG: energy transducer TonB [Pseudomonadota bacterium]